VGYRIGDRLQFKKSSGRRKRSKWVPVDVCEVHSGGMYGERTYSVWLLDSRRMVDFVRADELRFKYHDDLERRRAEEIERCREDMRRINLELTRQQGDRGFVRGRRMDRFGGGRGISQRAARTWQTRAHSTDRKVYVPEGAERQNERALSVPPVTASWPAFFAEFAKATYCGPRDDRDVFEDEQELNNFDDKTGIPLRDVRHNHRHIDDSGHDYRERVINMNRRRNRIDDRQEFKEHVVERTPSPTDNYTGDRRGGRDINVNFVMPGCKCQQDGVE